MKYIEEFRDKDLIKKLIRHIGMVMRGKYVFMEVCGGHTSAIHRFGIPSMLPSGISLISGPGCPVCVTAMDFIDRAIVLAGYSDVIIATFGDLIRVPGSSSSLERKRSAGADVRIIFSPLDALDIARENPGKKVVFAGIGFETTAPATAVTVLQAGKEKIGNFYVLSAHKLMPPVMEAVAGGGTALDGFICPGHVAAITGSGIFDFLPEKHGIGCAIAGFEPTDILQSVLMLVRQVNLKSPSVEIAYTRVVNAGGNRIALKAMSEVFEPCDTSWRGFGRIAASGLKLREEFAGFDAERRMPVEIPQGIENPACICPDILRGLMKPCECTLFGKGCTPDNPVGACMVSSEGACNTHYRYNIYE
ncbi:MAG TPA: hydrogenase formation protein HypD [Bacteroidales bacterium]|nr:hydrogenase formation protein HypD [Bacteroidales bacterium]HNR43255.1 hydrogenase formation protein HypD [Bacteroidales bacterium]HPV15875.1 hydrogenase formation protein HypD [Bacteroidales bacterium]HQG78090.1 hydrogenase formation protein HypD [Bacteroidales bacterium]